MLSDVIGGQKVLHCAMLTEGVEPVEAGQADEQEGRNSDNGYQRRLEREASDPFVRRPDCRRSHNAVLSNSISARNIRGGENNLSQKKTSIERG
jgi:hypothetical protein